MGVREGVSILEQGPERELLPVVDVAPELIGPPLHTDDGRVVVVAERLLRAELGVRVMVVAYRGGGLDLRPARQNLVVEPAGDRPLPGGPLAVAALLGIDEGIAVRVAPPPRAVRVLCHDRGGGVVDQVEGGLPIQRRVDRPPPAAGDVQAGADPVRRVEVGVQPHGVTGCSRGRHQAALAHVVQREGVARRLIAARHSHGMILERRRIVKQADPVGVRVVQWVIARERALDVLIRILGRAAGVDVRDVRQPHVIGDAHALREGRDVLHPEGAVVRDLHTFRHTGVLRRDENHAIGRARAVDRRRGRVLQHRDVLDVLEVHGVHGAFDPVNQDQRTRGSLIGRVVGVEGADGSAYRPLPADQDVRRVQARLPAHINHLEPGGETLERLRDGGDRQLRQLRAAHRADGAGEVHLLLRPVPDDHDPLQGDGGDLELEVGRDGPFRRHDDGLGPGTVAQPLDANDGRAGRHAADPIATIGIRARAEVRSLDDNLRAGEGRARVAGDPARDRPLLLRRGLGDGEPRNQQAHHRHRPQC